MGHLCNMAPDWGHTELLRRSGTMGCNDVSGLAGCVSLLPVCQERSPGWLVPAMLHMAVAAKAVLMAASEGTHAKRTNSCSPIA